MRNVCAAFLLLVGSSELIAGVTLFGDRATWEAALTAKTDDPFDNPISVAGGISITFDSGVVSTVDVNPFPAFDNRVAGGRYDSSVHAGGTGGPTTVTWTFPMPISAVGLDAIDVGAGPGAFIGTLVALRGDFDGTGDVVYPLTAGTSFLGLTSTSTFTTLQFFDNDGAATTDVFSVDNLAFGTAVPEPSAFSSWA